MPSDDISAYPPRARWIVSVGALATVLVPVSIATTGFILFLRDHNFDLVVLSVVGSFILLIVLFLGVRDYEKRVQERVKNAE